jgi:hypothetical protein
VERTYEEMEREMTAEWKDLPTMQDVASAQAAGHDIQVKYNTGWINWTGDGWTNYCHYRSRPLPKTRKVKMLCWYAMGRLTWNVEGSATSENWKRVPAQDLEIEVCDE